MNDELDRLAAAVLLPSSPAPEAPDWLLGWLERGVAGVVLFSNNIREREQLAALTAGLRAVRPELLVALDEEGGDVTRLEWEEGSSYPGNAALGAVDDVELTERVAASIAAELASVGVNLDLAPVADVNVNPANPVIGVRSFGSDPQLVARHVAAFVTGLQRNGVAACAKHFPGHGATEQDSHLELPTVTGDYGDGLVPFRGAIEARVQSVMTAHVRLAALDDAPATLSPAAIRLLRDALGFDGMVIADALEMGALSATVGVEEGAVRALEAGVDAVILGRRLGEERVECVHRALLHAVETGRLPEGRLREASKRVLRAATWASTPAEDDTPDRALGADAARRAIVAEGEVTVETSVLVVELQPEANIAAGEAKHSLGHMLAERLPGTVVSGDVPADPGGRQVVVVVRDAHRHPWIREVVEGLANPVVVEIGLPYWRPAAARGYLATHGGSRASFEAACELLLARVRA